MGMRWVFLGAVALLACSGEAFSPSEESAKGGEAGGSGGSSEPTGGKAGSAGKATGGADAEGGESSTGGSETGGKGGSGAASPTGGTDSGGSGGTAGCEEPATFYRDVDGDGYGRDSETVEACEAPAGYAGRGGDCADIRPQDANENPGSPELCNGDDDNCNDDVDEDDACPAGCVSAGGIVVECSDGAPWEGAVQACESLGLQLSEDYGVAAGFEPESWLGAAKEGGAWSWLSGGTVPNYGATGSQWADGQPSTAGLCMKYQNNDLGRRDAGWASEDCARALPFVCLKP